LSGFRGCDHTCFWIGRFPRAPPRSFPHLQPQSPPPEFFDTRLSSFPSFFSFFPEMTQSPRFFFFSFSPYYRFLIFFSGTCVPPIDWSQLAPFHPLSFAPTLLTFGLPINHFHQSCPPFSKLFFLLPVCSLSRSPGSLLCRNAVFWPFI